MSWFNVWDGFKNKTCRYLLQRYLGQFLEEKLNLEQLNVELYNGKATVKNVSLKVNALNELFEAQGWSVEVTGGKIGLITVTVPWNALMTNDSSIEISDLFICLRPLQRHNNGTSMLESMWSSVSSSMQLAQECMQQNNGSYDVPFEAQNNSIDGLEKFAETIDNVLNRIKAKCKNVVLRLEYLNQDCMHGIAVVIKISSLNYHNDAQHETSSNLNSKSNSFDNLKERQNEDESVLNKNIHLLSTFATHNISVNDVHIYTEEFQRACKKSSNCAKSFVEGAAGSFYSMTSECSSQEHCSNNLCEGISIPIVEIKGAQQIILKMKQSEEISGPKVILDVELGFVSVIITPRQIHLLSQFYGAFCDQESEINSDANNEPPLTSSVDSAEENIKNYCSNMTGGIGNKNIWSETYGEEATYRCVNVENEHDYKYFESISSSMSSSCTVESSARFQRKIANMDTCGTISKFNIKVAGIVIVVLQEDILLERCLDMSHSSITKESQLKMLKITQQFFLIFNNEFDDKHFGENKIFCNKNHLCLQAHPIIVDGMQQRNKSILLLKLFTTATKIDLYEVLEDKPTPLIYFLSDDGYKKRPELTFNIKSTTPFNYKFNEKPFKPPRTDFDINLDKCIIELDISIYDRLSAIVGPSPFKNQFSNSLIVGNNMQASKKIKQDPYTGIKLTSKNFEIKLRFPIVDARPIHDSDRLPWWKQNIRSDFIFLRLEQLRLTFNLNIIEILANEFNAFYCESSLDSKIHLLKVNMATTCESNSSSVPMFENPKITIETSKNMRIIYEDNKCGNSASEKCNVYMEANLPFSAKRVCRQSNTVHVKHDISEESETVLLPGEALEIRRFCDRTMKTSKIKININLPVVFFQLESKQLYELIYNRINSDLFMWEPSSPIFKNDRNIQHEQQMKQSIFTVGLLDSLYVPSTTLSNSDGTTDDLKHDKEVHANSKKKNSCLFSSSSESIYDDKSEKGGYSEDEANGIFNATHGNYNEIDKTNKPQSSSSFEITIGNGELTLIVPTRDIENRVLPGQLGKITAKLKALSIFFVNGFNSNEDLAYLCLGLKDLEVFHCGLIPVDSSMTIKNIGSPLPAYMQSTFYKTPINLTKGNGEGCNKREMLSLVIEIRKIPQQKIKRLKITSGIQNTTLRYNPALSPHTWVNQLIDFLDIMDYPITGYKPFGIISEMQLHIWDCAIDYRPKNFPFRAVVEIGTFNISSNIISSITGCTLRFVAEECILTIAPYNNKDTAYAENEISSVPSSDLVPVLDIGLLDISLRLSDISTEKCPKFDFRSSIQDVHLRTCMDSGNALAQLVEYLVNDGDVLKCNDAGESPSSSLLTSVYSESELLEVNDKKTQSAEISKMQQERVSELMAEAVQDTVTSFDVFEEIKENNTSGRGIEVFYFPDESNKVSIQPSPKASDDGGYKQDLSAESQDLNDYELRDILNFEANVMAKSYLVTSDEFSDALPQIIKDLGDISTGKNSIQAEGYDISQDDDYCLIGNEEKSYMSNYGIKNVKSSEDPLRIVDNHFCLPTRKQDLLKSPENFPMALLRYTLCEMTFTWHLYGGNDFPHNEGTTNQERVKESNLTSKDQKIYMSEAYKHGVSYSKGVLCGKKPKEKLTWKTIGGKNRNHEILVEIQLSKIRFSHEVYPKHTVYASRQVLIVNEVEIRDRLQSSDINKFLYHPKSNLPNKSNHNMIVIKALHVRPNPKINLSQECSLRISLLPLRLHIDQDTLLFLVQFFTSLGDNVNNENFQTGSGNVNYSSTTLRQTEAPIMMVEDMSEAVHDLHARQLVATNLDLLMEDNKPTMCTDTDELKLINDEYTPTYFKEVIFSPEVLVRLDYHGRRVELSRGPVAGLLMGLGQLQCSEIRLRKIVYKRGLLGVEKLITHLCKEWLKDIKKNQLPKILSGVGPTYAFVQLFQGIYDLFWLPIEQFQKDGRIIRGLQLGAQSFTARTALAALEITSRIIQILQVTAETAFDMVSPGPTVRRPRNIRRGKRKRPHRPKDIREGVTNAYTIVKEGFNDSAQSLIETAVAEHDQKGYTGAVGAVMRHIPQLVVYPSVLATQATTNILGGVKSSLVPEAKLDAREKWKDDTD